MIRISEGANQNYLAKVVQISKIRKHANADRLLCVTIDGNNVITGSDIKEGDIYVYFPLECAINQDYLSWSNSFIDKTLNADPEKAGFFGSHGRVKAIRLRGERSEGYIVPFRSLIDFVDDRDPADVPYQVNESNFVGLEFDTIDNILICKKYVPKNITQRDNLSKLEKAVVKRISRLVENQFRLHGDTAQLRKNIHQLNPKDLISITHKLHGTSFVVSNVLSKRKLSNIQFLAKRFLKMDIVDKEYSLFYASRRVVKNEYETANRQHFYKYDLWADIKESVKHGLEKGITLYGECVGYTNDGGYIQKGYDYGCNPGQFKTYIYRITQTNVDGKVTELSWPQIKEYCNKYDLTHVPEIYYGSVEKFYNIIPQPENYSEMLLSYMENLYTEKDCTFCKNKVPAEGVVVRKERLFEFEAYKLKSFRFLEHESKLLDEGVVDMETEESVAV